MAPEPSWWVRFQSAHHRVVSRPDDEAAQQAQSHAQAMETLSHLQEMILGAPMEYTRDEVAASAGLPIESTRAMWRAMGYADVGEALAFTASDIEAIHRFLRLVSVAQLDGDTATDLVRALGQTTARLADWQVNALAGHLERRGLIEPADGLALETLDVFGEELEKLMPGLEESLVYVWRRALATAVTRAASLGDTQEGSESGVLTVGFADMVGYTRLSRQLEEEELAGLVQRFEAVSSDVVAGGGGRVVKTVGDEVLFVADAAEDAAEIALRLHEAHSDEQTVPQMRVGLATGQVVSRMGDVFGTTVNLASRLTAMAKPGGTLVDAETRVLLRGKPGFALRAQRGRPVRGFGVLRPYVLNRPRSVPDPFEAERG